MASDEIETPEIHNGFAMVRFGNHLMPVDIAHVHMGAIEVEPEVSALLASQAVEAMGTGVWSRAAEAAEDYNMLRSNPEYRRYGPLPPALARRQTDAMTKAYSALSDLNDVIEEKLCKFKDTKRGKNFSHYSSNLSRLIEEAFWDTLHFTHEDGYPPRGWPIENDEVREKTIAREKSLLFGQLDTMAQKQDAAELNNAFGKLDKVLSKMKGLDQAEQAQVLDLAWDSHVKPFMKTLHSLIRLDQVDRYLEGTGVTFRDLMLEYFHERYQPRAERDSTSSTVQVGAAAERQGRVVSKTRRVKPKADDNQMSLW